MHGSASTESKREASGKESPPPRRWREGAASTLGAARWSTRLHGDNCEWGSCSESLHFAGGIYDVRIYDRVLSSAEIALLASDADDDGLLDEFSDFDEVAAGSDPNDAQSTPESIPAVPSLVGWAVIALCLCLVAGMVFTTKPDLRV